MEEDEVRNLFDEYFVYLNKVFANKTVKNIIKAIRDELIKSRSIDRADLLDMLAPLRH